MVKLKSLFYLSLGTNLIFLSISSAKALTKEQHEIEELKSQLNKIMKRIEYLERKPTDQINKKPALKKNDRTKIVVSGRVNRAILRASNGENSSIQHVDNGNANSLINLTATHKYNMNTDIGAEVEAKMRQNSSDSTDIKNSSNGSANIAVRKLNIFIESETWGRLALGRTSSASNTTMEATDLSLTDVISSGAVIASMAGGTTFINKNNNKKMYDSKRSTSSPYKNLINSDDGKININAVFGGNDTSGIDGLGYQDLIIYQTPVVKGFKIATSHAYASPTDGKGNDLWDIAIKHAIQFNQTKFMTHIAFVNNNTVALSNGNNTGYTQINGSTGMLLPSGLSFMLAATTRKWKYNDAHHAGQWSVKMGYQQQFWQAGITALSIDYGYYKNFVVDATSASTLRQQYIGQTHGIFMVQFLDRIASQVYIGWRHHRLNIKGNPSSKVYPINTLMSGILVKF